MKTTLFVLSLLSIAACAKQPEAHEPAAQPAASKPTSSPVSSLPAAKPVNTEPAPTPAPIPLPVETTPSAPVIDADHALTSAVRTALEHQLGLYDLEVSVVDGKVSLGGSVSTPAEKEGAEKVAKEVAGVHSVDNQLLVKGG